MSPVKPAQELLFQSGAAEESEEVSIADRRTPELVIAVVGPVGSGASFSAQILAERLESEYGYDVSFHKVSKLIEGCAALVGEQFAPDLTGAKRISRLQSIGNQLRERFSSNYLIEKCVESIAVERAKKGGYQEVDGNQVPVPRRHVHIIDSLKNPAEAELLRDVYGDIFWVVSVFAPEQVRRQRLLRSGVDKKDLEAVIARDENEKLLHGQNVRDTFQLADFFLRNDKDNDVAVKATIDRYLEIVFDAEIHTPTEDEAAMYNAVSAAAKSACMSRQVGAAIYSTTGELIGVGWNDVPKAINGGGLYTSEDKANGCDNRCYLWREKICHNDRRKDQLYRNITKKLGEEKLLKKGANHLDVEAALSATDIRNLIEFSRSVHAEMEAIISVARGGKSGLVGGTLYCTTYPCHSCARHIVASGISKVIYIELPYPKSLATELHGDSITTSEEDSSKMVHFLQYEGVAPKNVIRLFKHGRARKENGRAIERQKRDCVPIFQPAIDGFTTYEQMVVNEVVKKEQKGSARPN